MVAYLLDRFEGQVACWKSLSPLNAWLAVSVKFNSYFIVLRHVKITLRPPTFSYNMNLFRVMRIAWHLNQILRWQLLTQNRFFFLFLIKAFRLVWGKTLPFFKDVSVFQGHFWQGDPRQVFKIAFYTQTHTQCSSGLSAIFNRAFAIQWDDWHI